MKPAGQGAATAVPVRWMDRAGGRKRDRGGPVRADTQALAELDTCLAQAPVHQWGLDTPGLQRHELIEALHALNDHFGVLFDRHLAALAQRLHLPLAEVHEVASFYHHFERRRDSGPGVSCTVRVCDGLSCQLAGADALLSQTRAALASQPDVRVLPAPCLGRCEQAPAAWVGDQGVGEATAPGLVRVAEAFKANRAGTPYLCAEVATKNIAIAPEAQLDLPSAPRTLTDYCLSGGYQMAAAVVQGEMAAEDVLAVLEHSGLRGLGGAGFAAFRKWRIVAAQPGPRWLAVNLDEGEPGTFKDRTLLERDPHRLLEGILIAAQVVGCEQVVIYLRDEYPELHALLRQEIHALHAQPPCPLPAIQLRRGAGAYICGEESAMLQSIEGLRGEPRLRPPYVAEVGLFGQPTLAHNGETLWWLRDLLERGADWWTAHGRHGRRGLRSFSVSGRVRLPGVKIAPAGITVRELIDEYCGGMAPGHTLYAYLPGGASGGILPAALADVPLDFDTLQPHGCFIGSAAIIVLGHTDSARHAASEMMRFFADESCGQCTPCRVGTAKAHQLMAAPVWDAATLADLSAVMRDASICGLGQAAPNPVDCVLRYFAHEVTAA